MPWAGGRCKWEGGRAVCAVLTSFLPVPGLIENPVHQQLLYSSAFHSPCMNLNLLYPSETGKVFLTGLDIGQSPWKPAAVSVISSASEFPLH